MGLERVILRISRNDRFHDVETIDPSTGHAETQPIHPEFDVMFHMFHESRNRTMERAPTLPVCKRDKSSGLCCFSGNTFQGGHDDAKSALKIKAM